MKLIIFGVLALLKIASSQQDGYDRHIPRENYQMESRPAYVEKIQDKPMYGAKPNYKSEKEYEKKPSVKPAYLVKKLYDLINEKKQEYQETYEEKNVVETQQDIKAPVYGKKPNYSPDNEKKPKYDLDSLFNGVKSEYGRGYEKERDHEQLDGRKQAYGRDFEKRPEFESMFEKKRDFYPVYEPDEPVYGRKASYEPEVMKKHEYGPNAGRRGNGLDISQILKKIKDLKSKFEKRLEIDQDYEKSQAYEKKQETKPVLDYLKYPSSVPDQMKKQVGYEPLLSAKESKQADEKKNADSEKNTNPKPIHDTNISRINEYPSISFDKLKFERDLSNGKLDFTDMLDFISQIEMKFD